MNNDKAKAYWDKNEQALKDVGRFEGPKGVVYQVFRDMASVGSVVVNEDGRKAIAFDDADWEALSPGDVICCQGKPAEPVDFNKTFVLPACEISSKRASDPVSVSFDGAEGQGRVWLQVAPEHDIGEPWIAIEGEENARKLAGLLLAWADTYEGKA